MPNGNKFPFVLPDGYWKCEFNFYYKENVYLIIEVYFKSVTSVFGIF